MAVRQKYLVLKCLKKQAPTKFSELTYHDGQVVNDFYLPDISLDLHEISYMLERHVLFIMNLMINLTTIFYSVLLHCLHLSGYLGLF